jgi:AraC family transcriptional regulator of adaptative response/methylated-DNA-[protein]-cysteine methyltransferase
MEESVAQVEALMQRAAGEREITPDTAWAAVLERDRRFDGALVYAVRTTGVYCRPSCPSRRPRRENVTFYGSNTEAQEAGYRACMRCQPDSERGTTVERRVRQAAEYLEQHPDDSIKLDDLARKVGLSQFHLQRTFKRIVGLSPRAFQQALRMKRLRTHLRDGATVGRAVYEAGFGSSRGVYEKGRDALGMTPGEYRRRGLGLRIQFTTVTTSLGRLLMAATENGVCAVLLGTDDADLEQQLRHEFPHATLERDDQSLNAWLDGVARRVEGEHSGPALPLDLLGTAFQLRVWSALRAIAPGETRSYTEIAASIGQPTATRAVARACATNRTAILVPCHRVVRADGSAGGYRWGEERKQRLIKAERGNDQLR